VQEVGANLSCYVYAWPARPLALSIVQRALTFLDAFDRNPSLITEKEDEDNLYGDALIAHWNAQHRYPHGFAHFATIEYLLKTLAHKKATEPHDHVFALRSLYPSILGNIPIDYSMDISALFCEAAAALIESSAMLSQVLHYATFEATTKKQYLPSGVPDWTVQRDSPSWPWAPIFWGVVGKDGQPKARVSPDHRRLTIVAAPLGTVSTLSEPLPSITIDIGNELWLESLSGRFRSWLVVCAQDGIHDANERLYELLTAVLRPWMSSSSRPRREIPTISRKLWFCQNVAPIEPYLKTRRAKNVSLCSRDILRLKSKLSSGRLFITAGNTVCLCKDAALGDVVALLPMCNGELSTPWSEAWILRHAGEPRCYRVIGPAIVAGANEDRQRLDVLPLGDPETTFLV
jgi:hypothetical protein